MKRFWVLAGAWMLLFLLLFVLVEALGIPWLQNPQMEEANAGTATLGVGLLLVDVLLPVPSSLVMIAHGALFGVIGGTLLSLIGSTGAAMVGFAVGRRGGRFMDRVISPKERQQADALLHQWGWLAIIISRPIPILAETTAIMAGTSSLRWQTMFGASLVGSLPASLLYAITGATAARLDNFLLTFALVLLIAGLLWVVSTFVQTRNRGIYERL